MSLRRSDSGGSGSRSGLIRLALVIAFVVAFRRELGVLWRAVGNLYMAITGPPGSGLPLGPDVFLALWVMVLNIGGFLLIYWATLWFVSQFLMPAETRKERGIIYSLLLDHMSHMHGPVFTVKEGRENAHPGELNRFGRGVVRVDSCSAVVLEKQSPRSPLLIRMTHHLSVALLGSFARLLKAPEKQNRQPEPIARAEGPGIVFTGYNEKLRGVADLRPQIRFRPDVHAYTRDGIEVVTVAFAIFTLGQPPETLQVTYENERKEENLRVVRLGEKLLAGPAGKCKVVKEFVDELDADEKAEIHRFVTLGSTAPNATESAPPTLAPEDYKTAGPFHFFPERVFAAIYSQSQDTTDGSQNHWTELPASAAAEVARNMISREVYDNLYQPNDPELFPLKNVKGNFACTMRHMGVLAYQFIERSDGEMLAPGQELDEGQLSLYQVQEFRHSKLLRDRGIKLIHAGFTDLKPVNAAVRQRLVDNWRARWERDAEITLADQELKATRIRTAARVQGQREMALALSQIAKSGVYTREALAIRVFQALETAAADPSTRQLLPRDTIQMLHSLRYLLLPESEKGAKVLERSERLPEASPLTPDEELLPEDHHLKDSGPG